MILSQFFEVKMKTLRLPIRIKILIMLLLANSTLVLAIFVANQVAFDKSFSDYVQSATKVRLKPVIAEFHETMEKQQNVDWLDRRSEHWKNLMRTYHQVSVANENLTKKRPKPSKDKRPPARGERRGRGPSDKLFFKAVDGTLLVGRPSMVKDALWVPVYWPEIEGEKLGYIGVENGSMVTGRFETLFAKQQRQHFVVIAIIAFVITFLLSIPFSKYLVRPILALRKRTKNLTSGDYSISKQVIRRDELGQLESDMNLLAKTLAENLTARQRWIADISHELRTPIAVIKAEIEGMIDGVIEADGTQLDSLHEEILRLTKLVNDLHQLSMSDRGSLSYEKSKMLLPELIERSLEKRKNELSHFDLQFDFSPKCFLFCDAHRMGQLFDNLLQNTLRYTDASLDDKGKLEIKVNRLKHGVQLVWQDSSPGVEADQIAHLFDRLYRTDSARNRKTGGSGLGLAICQNIIMAHNGEVCAEQSELGGLKLTIEFKYKEN
ncbi:histidine kinase [Pseudoalteromonas phenolica]|uniref:histidine kinase n=2 Tax=Pseudoalteromonas phenolica TaxID=161398 RepID=A0A0S2K045_9GAMM|nr:histidine kinase [Pseudoalteromonas phenolica]MBE0354059.1 two-component system, OmpR family, sensor histidine kinase BaeS [Pseudoalteromonas phenolica O-BC30]